MGEGWREGGGIGEVGGGMGRGWGEEGGNGGGTWKKTSLERQ